MQSTLKQEEGSDTLKNEGVNSDIEDALGLSPKTKCDTHLALRQISKVIKRPEGYVLASIFIKDSLISEQIINVEFVTVDGQNSSARDLFKEQYWKSRASTPWIVCDQCIDSLGLNEKEKELAKSEAKFWWADRSSTRGYVPHRLIKVPPKPPAVQVDCSTPELPVRHLVPSPIPEILMKFQGNLYSAHEAARKLLLAEYCLIRLQEGVSDEELSYLIEALSGLALSGPSHLKDFSWLGSGYCYILRSVRRTPQVEDQLRSMQHQIREAAKKAGWIAALATTSASPDVSKQIHELRREMATSQSTSSVCEFVFIYGGGFTPGIEANQLYEQFRRSNTEIDFSRAQVEVSSIAAWDEGRATAHGIIAHLTTFFMLRGIRFDPQKIKYNDYYDDGLKKGYMIAAYLKSPVRGQVSSPNTEGLATKCLLCGMEVLFSQGQVRAAAMAYKPNAGLRFYAQEATAKCLCGATGRLRKTDQGEFVVDW